MALGTSTSSIDSTRTSESDAAISARTLRRTFKGGIEAVRHIDLTVGAGQVFGFLGPNGAGKTTTVRMFCTLLPPTAGDATVAGIDVVRGAAQARRRIGVALQEIGLDPVQTERELLELQCGLYGITGLGVAYAGFAILIALRTRNVQATQASFILFFPLLFLTPNFVPFDRLTAPMDTLAHINPVSYVIVGLRSLVIDGWDAGQIAVCVAVIVGLGVVLTVLSLRTIARYDR